jgi:hypothetical protein
MRELTQEQLELVAKAYEILAQDEVTAKLMIGFPIPPKKP